MRRASPETKKGYRRLWSSIGWSPAMTWIVSSARASKVGEIERRAVELERGGLEPGDVDDLVRELGQPARLLRGAGDMLP